MQTFVDTTGVETYITGVDYDPPDYKDAKTSIPLILMITISI